MDAFVKVYFWAALPEILSGVRIGFIRAVKGVIIGITDLQSRFRCAVRSRFRLFLSRREIVADIRKRLSGIKIERWSDLEADQALALDNTIGVKIRRAYGMYDVRNPFVEIDPLPDPDGKITNQYFPDNVSVWVINQIRMECREAVYGS